MKSGPNSDGYSKRHRSSAGRGARWALVCVLIYIVGAGQSVSAASVPSLLAHDNLIPWELRWDQAKEQMGVEQRARVLAAHGIKHHAIMYSSTTASELDTLIPAYRREGVELAAVYFWLNTEQPGDDAQVRAAFDALKKLKVRPQIWVSQSTAFLPKTPEQWKQRFADAGFEWPAGYDLSTAMLSAFSSRDTLTEAQKESFFRALHRVYSEEANLPRTPEEQALRVEREALRVASLATLASRYGLEVGLYNHNGWFGVMENQLAMIDKLKRQGIKNVSIVYTFWHARDSVHDEVKDFGQVWAKIQPHVTAVAISGVRGEMESLYPAEGEDELAMMRVVQQSGWKGPVGALCLNFGMPPETVLRDVLRGIDWLAAELHQPGSGGARPIFRTADAFQQSTE